MKRISLCLLLWLAFLGNTAIGSGPQQQAPNILILIADDLGWGDVGFHKGMLSTPHLDQLAKEGMELQRFYAYPVCSPTRAAFLTGQMPRRFGIADVVGPQQCLPVGIATLPGTLRAAGYTTSLIGKWHLGKSGPPRQNGFDHFYGFLGPEIDYFKHTDQRGETDWQRDEKTLQEQGYSTFLFADEAIRQLKRCDPARPFFMEVAFNAVHIPRSAPEELLAHYGNLSPQEATYAAVTEALDISIGRILTALKECGLEGNTIVLFFSDNGSGGRGGGSNAPFRGGKSTMFEGGIRMPCLLRWPGKIKADSLSQQPVAVHDLFPTLAAAVSVKVPANLDGKNLWEALRSGKVQDRGFFVIAGNDLALIEGDWKLIETADGKCSLFQLVQDPGETSDLISSQPGMAARLETELAGVKKNLPAVSIRPRPRPGGQGRPPNLEPLP